MVYLGDLAQGRDNNLNLIRAIAATAVLVSHAWPLTLGDGAVEPLRMLTGHTLGSISVWIFFAISGFLITASFERTSTHLSFLLARILRLFPGLLVSLVLVAFVMGPLVTTLPAGTYLTLPDPYLFVARDLALFPLVFHLPGVFETNPYPAVEGSIWTLRHEVLCYAGVFLVGLVGAWRSAKHAAIPLGLFAVLWLAIEIAEPPLPHLLKSLHGLAIHFAIGTAFYVWRRRLPISLLGVLATAALAWILRHTVLDLLSFALMIAYTTFWVAYVPGGWIRNYNRIGDYSYGIYIYAFPLQGLAVWLFGPQPPLMNVVYAFPMTLVLSIASWHLVEEPSMRAKGRILRWLGQERPAAATKDTRLPGA